MIVPSIDHCLKGALLALLSFCLLFLFSSNTQARTIALVYDNSGSMLKNDSWIYANYATQVLAASLRADDELVTIQMNGGLVRGKSPLVIKNWDAPVDGAKTPYSAVEKAMQVLQSAPVSTENGVVQADEKNWLIITTDGEFDRAADAGAVRRFFSQTHGQVEVVFLLIGEVRTETAALWKNISPDQVQTFQVKSDHGGFDLIEKMNRVAALVAGRDNQEPAGINRSGRRIAFSSPFPIRRITLLMQQTDSEDSLPDLGKVEFKDGTGSGSVNFVTKTIESRTGRILKSARKAKVIHCLNNTILPSGEYSLEFDENIQGLPLQVLVEAAVDLDVSLYDASGNKLPSTGREYTFCDSDPLQIGVTLLTPRSKTPLQLNPSALNLLQVKSLLSGQTEKLTYQEKTGEFRSEPQNLGQGDRTLAVEAHSPGYFFLKSNIFSLNGTPCRRQGEMKIRKTQWKVPYTFSESQQEVSESTAITIVLENNPYTGPNRSDSLLVEGLPRGVELNVAGEKVSRDNPQIELPTLKNGQRLQLTLTRNREYTAEKMSEISLNFSSGSWVEWGKPVVFQVTPQPRDVVLQASPQQWSAAVTEMGKQPPVTLRLMINGSPVAKEEFDLWSIDEEHDGYFSLKTHRDDDNKVFNAKPGNFFFSPILTSVGDFSANLELRGPFPLEEVSLQLPVRILWASWWERARNTILFVMGLFFFLWWLLRIVSKKRFASSATICFEHLIAQQKKSYNSEALKNSVMTRWLIPTKAEKKNVNGLLFQAGNRDDHVLIVRGQLDKKARIGGMSLELHVNDIDKLDDTDLILHNNEDLEIPKAQGKEIYRYEK